MSYKMPILSSALFIAFSFLLALNANAAKLTVALARNTITPAEENYTYAVPKQLGYFAQEGLDVSILPTDGSTAALQAVASGSADIAYASSANIAAAIDKGVKLKAFAGITLEWPYFIGVPKGAGMKTLADLKGKRIGVISLASASYSDLIASLKLAGMTADDVIVVPVGAGARAAAALKSHHVDAIDSYTDSFTVMAQNGVDVDYLPRPKQMDKLFSVTMVTSQRMIDTKPETLAAFARAAYRGIIYTKLYPDSALQYSFKEFPQLLGSEDPHGHQAQETEQAMAIALSYTIPKGENDPTKWGEWLNLPIDRWQAVLDFAYSSGLTTKKLSVDEIWDDRLMPEIYNFDPKAIKLQN